MVDRPARLKSALLAFVESQVVVGTRGADHRSRARRDGDRWRLHRVARRYRARRRRTPSGCSRARRPGPAAGSKIGLFVARGVAETQGGRAWAEVTDGRLVVPSGDARSVPTGRNRSLARLGGLMDADECPRDPRGRARPRSRGDRRGRDDARGAGRLRRRCRAGPQNADSPRPSARSARSTTRNASVVGMLANEVRDALNRAVDERRAALEARAESRLLEADRVDCHAPGTPPAARLAASADARGAARSSMSSLRLGFRWSRDPRSRTTGTTSRR